MAKFTTSVPPAVAKALQVETAFSNISDELEQNYRLASGDESLCDLIDAVSDALDQEEGPSIGLSASCKVIDGKWTWAVLLGVDYGMTVICSQEDYTNKSDIQIAKIICECWQSEWNT